MRECRIARIYAGLMHVRENLRSALNGFEPRRSRQLHEQNSSNSRWFMG